MSVLRPKPPEDPIVLSLGHLAAPARDLLPGFDDVPRPPIAASLQARQLLSDYMTDRPASELFRALGVARHLRESVDAVAVLCGEPLGDAVRGLFETCCHPFHNQLSRGERGGRPRLFFANRHRDPDREAGLADLIVASRGDDLLDRWGVVQLASVCSAATASEPLGPAAFGDSTPVAFVGRRCVAPSVTLCLAAPSDQLADVFAPAVLTTASAAGIDVVRLLSGGVAMLRRFLESPAESNPPMLLAAAIQAAAEAAPPSGLILDPQLAPAATSLARWWRSQSASLSAGAPPTVHPCRLVVREHRRLGPQHAAPPPIASPLESSLAIDLPRLDEHTVGQLCALRLLALRLLGHRGCLSNRPPQA